VPAFPPIAHVAVTVTDLAQSTRWYTELLGAEPVLDEDEEAGYYLEETIEANTISDVLRMTQYEARDLAAKLKTQVDAAIKQDRLKPTEGMRLLAEYERGLKDHTYLTFSNGNGNSSAP